MKTTTYATRAIIAMLSLAAAACQLDRPTGAELASGDVEIRTPTRPLTGLDPSGNCSDCRVGPVTFVRQQGAPMVVTRTFAATAGQTFVVDLDDLGSKGADASVALNGVTLLPSRGDGAGPARHYREMVTAQSNNTLEIRLVGKPGSMLRVAVWLFRPVTIDVTLPLNTHLGLEMDVARFQTIITNNTTGTLTGLWVHVAIRQASAERGSGSNQVAGCGAPPGSLPPGTCVQDTWAFASNGTGGHGTLVPGPAVAIITLYGPGPEVLDAVGIPVIIEPEFKVPGSVEVTPTNSTIAIGGQVQLTATVRADDGTVLPGRFVAWNTSNPAVAAVSQAGLVTGVSVGFANITATTGNGKTGGTEVNVTPP